MKSKEELKKLIEDWLNEEAVKSVDIFISVDDPKQILIGVYLK